MDSGPNTSATGAAFGAAVGAIVVWLIEVLTAAFGSAVDVPAAVEGAIVVVVTYLVARFISPTPNA